MRDHALGSPAIGEISGAPMRRFRDGRITVFDSWFSDLWNTDDLIGRADVVGGIRFAPLSDVLQYKRILKRPKDLTDIALIHEHLDAVADGKWCSVCASRFPTA